jgi:hypothetical protein
LWALDQRGSQLTAATEPCGSEAQSHAGFVPFGECLISAPSRPRAGA